MAKPPETRERFRIFCETDTDEDMGRVVGQLTRMGFKNVGFELITDVPTFGKNGPRVKHDVKAEDFAAEYIEEHPTFGVIDLVKHFEANNRTAGAAYTAVRVMVEKGTLKKLRPGTYQSADVKALAPPAADKPAEANRRSRQNYEISNHDFLWKHFKNRKSFKASEVMELFMEHGRPTKSASSQLSQMREKGLFKRIGEGEYAPVKKNPPEPKPHVNGTGGTVTAETAHG